MFRLETLGGPFGPAVCGPDLAAGIGGDGFRAPAPEGRDCGEDACLEFGRKRGAPIPHAVDAARVPGYPEMPEAGNDTRCGREDGPARNGAAFRHTDRSCGADAAMAAMPYARKVPDTGAEARIAARKAARDDLDADMRARIDGLRAVHFYGAASGRGGERRAKPPAEAQAALHCATPIGPPAPPGAQRLRRRIGVRGKPGIRMQPG